MAKKQRKAGGATAPSSGKPKHSLDSNRSSKAELGKRDAATVSEAPSPAAAADPARREPRAERGCAAQVRRLEMYKKRAVRDKNGHLIYQVGGASER